MKEPLRWVEDPEAPIEARRLLQAARPTPWPDPERLPVEPPPPTGEAAATSALSSVAAKAGAGTLLAGLAVLGLWREGGSVDQGPVGGARSQEGQPATPSMLEGVFVGPPAPPRPEPVSSPPTPDPGAEPPRAQRPERRRRAGATRDEPRPASEPAPAAATPPAVEAPVEPGALLLEARRALASEPQRSMQLIERHRALFPSTALDQERALLELRALRALGRRAELDEARRRFLRRFPDSPYRGSLP